MKTEMRTIILLIVLLALTLLNAAAQSTSWKFAHVSDTHIGSDTAEEDLRRTVKDINADPDLQFVVISGDITEFGSDTELRLAKSIFDGLKKPWYIVPGNHDMNWSESGGNSFRKVFGSETFATKHNGVLFLGTNCGPNMRMSPGQVPRENLVWLDSVMKVTPITTPIIFVNHYPLNSSLNNWYEVMDKLKTHNTQLILCGHGHSNQHYNFEGIPGIMGRSNLRAKDSVGGYNIVTMREDSVIYNERAPGIITKSVWTKDRLFKHDFTKKYPRPSFEVNKRFPAVKIVWSLTDNNDIGAGMAITDKMVMVTNTGGWVKAYNTLDGKVLWSVKTRGKVYSTPSVAGNMVVVASTDSYLYGINKTTGKLKWKAATGKPLVASPVIKGNKVFCGSADGHFRCYELSSGRLKWDFKQVPGFVVTRPLLYNGRIYFGSWGNQLFALDQQTGVAVWKWNDGYSNRMFSPASCVPVATGNRLFVVAPDRYMTCFNASTGEVIWRKGNPDIRVRESMGLSADSSLVYVKTMDGDVLGMSAMADTMDIKWKGAQNMGYDISPSVVQEHEGLVFALSNSGMIYAFNRKDGLLAWMYKVSNCLVNPISFLKDRKLIVTTMDGKIVCLEY